MLFCITSRCLEFFILLVAIKTTATEKRNKVVNETQFESNTFNVSESLAAKMLLENENAVENLLNMENGIERETDSGYGEDIDDKCSTNLIFDNADFILDHRDSIVSVGQGNSTVSSLPISDTPKAMASTSQEESVPSIHVDSNTKEGSDLVDPVTIVNYNSDSKSIIQSVDNDTSSVSLEKDIMANSPIDKEAYIDSEKTKKHSLTIIKDEEVGKLNVGVDENISDRLTSTEDVISDIEKDPQCLSDSIPNNLPTSRGYLNKVTEVAKETKSSLIGNGLSVDRIGTFTQNFVHSIDMQQTLQLNVSSPTCKSLEQKTAMGKLEIDTSIAVKHLDFDMISPGTPLDVPVLDQEFHDLASIDASDLLKTATKDSVDNSSLLSSITQSNCDPVSLIDQPTNVSIVNVSLPLQTKIAKTGIQSEQVNPDDDIINCILELDKDGPGFTLRECLPQISCQEIKNEYDTLPATISTTWPDSSLHVSPFHSYSSVGNFVPQTSSFTEILPMPAVLYSSNPVSSTVIDPTISDFITSNSLYMSSAPINTVQQLSRPLYINTVTPQFCSTEEKLYSPKHCISNERLYSPRHISSDGDDSQSSSHSTTSIRQNRTVDLEPCGIIRSVLTADLSELEPPVVKSIDSISGTSEQGVHESQGEKESFEPKASPVRTRNGALLSRLEKRKTLVPPPLLTWRQVLSSRCTFVRSSCSRNSSVEVLQPITKSNNEYLVQVG